MSEYVFNTGSNDGLNGSAHMATGLVRTLIETIAALDDQLDGEIRPLKLPADPWDLKISEGGNGQAITLGEIINEFHSHGETRDLATFFDALQCYAPAVELLSEQMIEAILRLEPIAPADGYEQLHDAACDAGFEALQCAITGGTLVSLAYPRWDFDELVVVHEQRVLRIDHASRPQHADAIANRRVTQMRNDITRENFEAVRSQAFPSLRWGQDIPGQIRKFPSEYLALTFKRLAALDDMVRQWQISGDAVPPQCGLELTGESDLTMQNYGGERAFRSSDGTMRTYETHVWIDKGNRIHLILDSQARTVDVGYIGPHLRTWRYG